MIGIRIHTAPALFLALSLFLAAAPAALAQDNDDEGVLPAIHGSGGALGSQAPNTVSVSGEIEDVGDLAGGQATLRLGGATGIAASSEPDGSMIQSGGGPVRACVGEGDIALQGSLTLVVPEQFEVVLEAPADSVQRTSWIVLHADQESLDDLLAGEGQPLALVHAGAIDGLDVAAFQRLVLEEAGALQGLAISWVVGSVDGAGTTHLAGVKVPTDGGLLEVVAR